MDLTTLRAAFTGRLHLNATDCAPFLTDWRRKWRGQAIAVAQPDSVEGAAAIVRWCVANRVPVVPQGGNTGLSGGATPDGSGQALLLSLVRLNRIRGVDALGNTIEVEAGVTLQHVQEAARAVARLFPLDLAAKGTCTIGGNLATNAGGVQVLRYGTARDLCLGLEVVTPDGQIWNGLRALRKDNSGYDLRALFIGSEGTLGIITAAALKLFAQPAAKVVAFVAVNSPETALRLLELSQARLGSSLTAFELMSDICIGLVERHVPTARLPLSQRSPWYVLLEVSDEQNEDHARTSLEALFERALEQELATDAALASSVAQFEALWALRENISESQAAEGRTIKHDIALPISRIAEFIHSTDAAIARQFPGLRMVVFGHLGDGNLHYNLSAGADRTGAPDAPGFVALEPAINRLVHDAVVARGGSISAEHGLGVLRRDEAGRYKSTVELDLMHAIKRAFDPNNLMNPGKLLAANINAAVTEH